jgi:hypothetical protein
MRQEMIPIMLSTVFGLFCTAIFKGMAIYIIWNLIMTKVLNVASLTFFNVLWLVIAWALISAKIDLKFKGN